MDTRTHANINETHANINETHANINSRPHTSHSDNEPLTDYELTLMASGELHANGATVLPNGLVEVRRSSMPLGALVKAKNNKRHLSARGRAAVDGRGAAVDEARAQSRSPTRPAPGAGPSRPSTGNTKLAMFGPGDAKRQKTRERILEKHMQKIAATVGGGQQ